MVEQAKGSFSYLFPFEDRIKRYRSQIEQAHREAWAAKMGGPLAAETPQDIIAHVVLSNIKLPAVVSCPVLRVQLQGPGELIFAVGWTPSRSSVNSLSRLFL